jgi:hypothetical protein
MGSSALLKDLMVERSDDEASRNATLFGHPRRFACPARISILLKKQIFGSTSITSLT